MCKTMKTWMVALVALGLVTACGGSGGLGSPSAKFEPGVTQGPVLGVVTPTSVKIRFGSTNLVHGGIEYGPMGQFADRVEAAEAGPVHELTLPGLQPGTTYQYRVLMDGEPGERTYTFRTAPGDPNAPVRVVAFGDSGCGCDAQFQVGALVARENPDVVLLLGDAAYPAGTAAEVRSRLLVPFADLLARIPFYVTLGNHDVETAAGQPVLAAMPLPTNTVDGGETFFRFDHGCASFLSINAEWGIEHPGTPQVQWIESQLQGPNRAWKIAFSHRPTYSAGAHSDHVPLHQNVAPLFDQYGVDFHLAGHDHNYQRSHPIHGGAVHVQGPGDIVDPPGTIYMVSGGGGKSLYGVNPADTRFAAMEASYHVTVMDFTPDQVLVRAVRIDGSEIERVVVRRTP